MTGHDLGINNRHITLGGKPFLPIMGEFQFSRYPSQKWEEEILKMKAGGSMLLAPASSGSITATLAADLMKSLRSHRASFSYLSRWNTAFSVAPFA